MIITCPDCATRYDVDDARFSPNGRSVRCSACGESWFVPAPELIDVEPLEEKTPSRGKNKAEDREEGGRPRIKVGFADDEEDSRAGRRRESREECRRYEKNTGRRAAYQDDPGYPDDEEDEDDDSLFDPPPVRRGREEAPARAKDADEPIEKGWRKGRQFIVEDEEDEADHRSFFARKRKEAPKQTRESLRFADDESDVSDRRASRDEEERFEEKRSAREEHEDEDDAYNAAYIVDADWEAVEDGQERGRGFGRRIRAERRRATALARLEDVRPLDPRALDDEFFAALRVTPRELERAIRKARRRAEAREKNRLTPMRVIGWTAWLAVIGTACYALFIYRNEIVKAAPKAADAYAVIGIEANPYGLAIENVRHRLAMSTGGPTIEITGNLRNETDHAVDAPLLQAEALGPRGELLARWTFSADEAEVGEGGAVDFVTRAPAPDGVAEVALSFAPEKTVLDSLLPKKN